jgi:hypothetical protein
MTERTCPNHTGNHLRLAARAVCVVCPPCARFAADVVRKGGAFPFSLQPHQRPDEMGASAICNPAHMVTRLLISSPDRARDEGGAR